MFLFSAIAASSNRRNNHAGHIFQGRYKSILVQKVKRRQVRKSLKQFREKYPERDRAMRHDP